MNKKQRWFNSGVAAYRIARPGGPAVYCCPLCLGEHVTPESLTVEHVPPEAAEGRSLVLTCFRCNNTAGHALDHHLVKARTTRRYSAGMGSIDNIRAQVVLEAGTVNARLSMRPNDELSIEVSQAQNSPETQHAVMDYLNERVKSRESLHGTLRIWPPNVDPWAEKRAWLRVGYLIAFAALGYRYALDRALDVVRAQILGSGDDVAGMCVSPPEPQATAFTRIIFIQQPEALAGLAVQIEGQIVMLPRGGDLDFYPRADCYIQQHGRLDQRQQIAFEGLEIPWPTEPILAADFAGPRRYLRGLLRD